MPYHSWTCKAASKDYRDNFERMFGKKPKRQAKPAKPAEPKKPYTPRVLIVVK